MKFPAATLLALFATVVYSYDGCLKCNQHIQVVPAASPVKLVYRDIPSPYHADLHHRVPVVENHPSVSVDHNCGYQVEVPKIRPCHLVQEHDFRVTQPQHLVEVSKIQPAYHSRPEHDYQVVQPLHVEYPTEKVYVAGQPAKHLSPVSHHPIIEPLKVEVEKERYNNFHYIPTAYKSCSVYRK